MRIFTVGLILLIGGLIWGNESISVSEYTYMVSGEDSSLDGIKLVQLSDLHDKTFGENHRRLIRVVEDINPDFILITGDLIDRNTDDFTSVMDLLDQLTEFAPVYLVTGNHEAWNDERDTFFSQLEETDVVLLDNEIVTIEWEDTTLTFLGASDPAFCTDLEESTCLDTWLSNAMDLVDGHTILLSHRPELWDTYLTYGVDLVLSGHAHGGQVRVPFLGGVIAPDQGFWPRFSEGQIEHDGTIMIVSRGLGNSILPLRVNNRPEVVVVTYRSGEE
jgi:predicted MPP superfamily phosphohydrolase